MFNAQQRGNKMTTKPATPLPAGVPPDEGIYIGNLYTTPRTIAIWREQANAYPELVAALRDMTEAHSADTVKAAIQHYGRNRGEVEKASKARTAARALLAKLGETA